jgi:Tfp pilus assembly protein PilF
VLRLTGDLMGSLRRSDDALALDPYNFMALLSKGFLLEKMGRPKAAAGVYRNALKIAPEPLPPPLQPPVERARS